MSLLPEVEGLVLRPNIVPKGRYGKVALQTVHDNFSGPFLLREFVVEFNATLAKINAEGSKRFGEDWVRITLPSQATYYNTLGTLVDEGMLRQIGIRLSPKYHQVWIPTSAKGVHLVFSEDRFLMQGKMLEKDIIELRDRPWAVEKPDGRDPESAAVR